MAHFVAKLLTLGGEAVLNYIKGKFNSPRSSSLCYWNTWRITTEKQKVRHVLKVIKPIEKKKPLSIVSNLTLEPTSQISKSSINLVPLELLWF